MNYYYSHEHQPHGPVTEEQLKKLLLQGIVTVDTPILPEGSTKWIPYRRLDIAPTRPPPTTLSRPLAGVNVQPPPGVPPAPSAAQDLTRTPDVHRKSYRRLVITSWIFLASSALIAIIPVLGFATWVIPVLLFLTTLVLGILTIARGATRDGVIILVASLLIVPLYILTIIVVTGL